MSSYLFIYFSYLFFLFQFSFVSFCSSLYFYINFWFLDFISFLDSLPLFLSYPLVFLSHRFLIYFSFLSVLNFFIPAFILYVSMLFVLVSLFVFLIYIYLSLPHILLIYFTFSPFLISDCATPTPYSILSIFQLCYSVIYIYTPWVSFFVLPVLTSFSISSFSLSVFTSHCSFISSWCIYLLHVPFSLSSNLSPSHLVFPLPSLPLPDPFLSISVASPPDPFFHPFDSDPWLILRAVFLPSRASLMKPRANYRISSRKSPRKTDGVRRRVGGGPLKTMNSRISRGGMDKGATPF